MGKARLPYPISYPVSQFRPVLRWSFLLYGATWKWLLPKVGVDTIVKPNFYQRTFNSRKSFARVSLFFSCGLLACAMIYRLFSCRAVPAALPEPLVANKLISLNLRLIDFSLGIDFEILSLINCPIYKSIALTVSAIPTFYLWVSSGHSANVSSVLHSACAFRPIYCAIGTESITTGRRDCVILWRNPVLVALKLRIHCAILLRNLFPLYRRNHRFYAQSCCAMVGWGVVFLY